MIEGSRISSRRVTFEASPSPDVAGYYMYYCPEDEELTANSPKVDIGNRTEFVVPDDFPEDDPIRKVEGIYRAAIVAYDEEGNTAPAGPEAIVPLDFRPPLPAGAISVSPVG